MVQTTRGTRIRHQISYLVAHMIAPSSCGTCTRIPWYIFLVFYVLFWFILVYFGLFWFILVYFGLFWFILVYFGLFWFILVYFVLNSFILLFKLQFC